MNEGSSLHRNSGILDPVDSQDMDVVWELVPDKAGIPIGHIFDFMRVNSNRFGLLGNYCFEIVVAESLEGFG